MSALITLQPPVNGNPSLLTSSWMYGAKINDTSFEIAFHPPNLFN